jgi:hypothetical protein
VGCWKWTYQCDDLHESPKGEEHSKHHLDGISHKVVVAGSSSIGSSYEVEDVADGAWAESHLINGDVLDYTIVVGFCGEVGWRDSRSSVSLRLVLSKTRNRDMQMQTNCAQQGWCPVYASNSVTS